MIEPTGFNGILPSEEGVLRYVFGINTTVITQGGIVLRGTVVR